jgi:hypothetical protein
MSEAKQYVLPVPRKRGVIYFLIANVLAFLLCGLVFAAVWSGEVLTFAADAVWSFLATHSSWSMGAALSPLFAALVLGYGYMRRAMLRRAREREESLRAAAAAAGTTLVQP